MSNQPMTQPNQKPDFDAIRRDMHELVDKAVDVLQSIPEKRWPITDEMLEKARKLNQSAKRKRAARKGRKPTD